MKTIIIFILFCFVLQNRSIMAQNVLFDQQDSLIYKNITFEISAERSNYQVGNSITINYKFLNNSNEKTKILMKEYWGFPMGMAANINSENGLGIVKYPSRHFLSSQLFTEEELKGNYIVIEPNEIISGKVILQKIPVFQDNIIDGIIPKGLYKINLKYIMLISNTIEIMIE